MREKQRRISANKVTFSEASTVFGDFFRATVAEPDHSADERRYITVGASARGRLLIVAHAQRGKRKATDDLLPAYNLNELLRGSVRGKYAKRYHADSNVVMLDPEVRRAFRNEKAVNDALRLVIELRKIGRERTRVSRN